VKLSSFFTLVCAIFLASCATLTERTVTVTQAQIQQKLQDKLIAPITVLKFFNVALSQPVIQLDGQTERMTASLDALVSNPLSRALKGKATISGKLRFDVPSNAILLTDAKIESLNVEGLGSRSSELLTLLGQQLGADLLDDLPLYTLKPDDLKVAGIVFAPKQMRITPQGLQVVLSPK
jgi:hypothetical protein